MTIRDLLVRFGADTSGFSAGTHQVKRELDGLNTKLFENRKELQTANKEYSNAQKGLNAYAKKIKDFSTATDEQKSKMAEMSAKADQASLKVGRLRTTQQELQAQIKAANGSLQDQTQQMRGVGSGADSASRSIGHLATAVKALILGYTGKKLYEVLIGSNAEMEQYVANFEVMLGSAEKSQTLMKKLTEFASRTPLGMEDTVKSANLLMNYGVAADDVIGKMTQLGDLAGGNADKLNRVSLAYGQMLAKGKVTGEELRQMTEAGIPLLTALSDSMGVTTAELQKMITAGQVGIPELNAAIESLTTGAGKFAGLMEKQSQTVNGMLSTLKDEFVQFGRDAGEQGFETVRGTLAQLMKEIRSAKESGELAQVSNQIGNSIGKLVNVLVGAIKIGWEWRGVIIGGATALKTLTVVLTVVDMLKKLEKAQQAVAIAQTALNAVTIANPYVLLTSALVGVTAGLIAYSATAGSTAKEISALQDEARKTTKELEEMDSVLKDLQSGGLGGSVEGMSQLVLVSDRLIPKIEDLRNKTERTAGENQILKQYIDRVNEALGYEAYALDIASGALSGNTKEIQTNVAARREMLRQKQIMKQYDELTEKLYENEDNWKKAVATRDEFIRKQVESPYADEVSPDPTHDQFMASQAQKSVLEFDKNRAEIERQMDELDAELLKSNEKIGENMGKTSVAFAETVDDTAKNMERLKLLYQAGEVSGETYANQIKMKMTATKSVIDSLFNEEYATDAQQEALNTALNQYTQYQSELDSIEKKAASGSATAGTAKTEAQADTFKLLQLQRNSDLISQEEYYNAVFKLAMESKAMVDALNAIHNPTDSQKKALQDSLEEYQKYYAALEAMQKESNTAVKNWVSEQSKAYTELYNYRKTLLDKQYKERTEQIDNELAAEEKRVNAIISDIDAEMKARERLKESDKSDREIEAVAARLKYDQLDEFSRDELERKLSRLKEEKSEREWLNSKNDEKEQLKNQLALAKEEADSRKQRLKEYKEEQEEMLSVEKEKIEEVFSYLTENFDSLAELEQAGIKGINDIFLIAVASEQREVDNTFTKIKNGTMEVADLYAATINKKVGETFDYQVARGKAALQELESAIGRAYDAIDDLREASRSRSSSTTYATTASINISNPYYSQTQIANKVIDLLYDPTF